MTSIEEIEQIIKPILLTGITFTVDNKVLKRGKLVLFSVKDFFCTFTLTSLDDNNKKVIYEIPYPFSTCTTMSSVEFDYTVDSFCLGNDSIRNAVNNLDIPRLSKFYNKKVVVISDFTPILNK
jgi:hypothetical protein